MQLTVLIKTPSFYLNSPADGAKSMDFEVSSLATASRMGSLSQAMNGEHIAYGKQHAPLKSSFLSDAVQPLPSLGTHSRGFSDTCLPSPIGRHSNLIRNDSLYSKHLDHPSNSLIVDHHGSDLLRGTSQTINNPAATPSYISFLDGDAAHSQGGATTTTNNAINISSNSSKFSQSATVEGIGGISLSPPINRIVISEDHPTLHQFSSENSSNKLFDNEDYSPSGKFLSESPYLNTNSNKDGFHLRSRAFSSPGPLELPRQGLFSGGAPPPLSPSKAVSPWQANEYHSPVKKSTGAHHMRSYTLGYFPNNNDDVTGKESLQQQYSLDSFRPHFNSDIINSSGTSSPKWQHTIPSLTASPVAQQRLAVSKSDVQLARQLSQGSHGNVMSLNNEMNRSSSFNHTSTMNIRVPTGFDQAIGSTSLAASVGTPRSALYYPEKDGHYGQAIDQNNDYVEEQQESMHGLSNHVSHPFVTNNYETAAYQNNPNASIPSSIAPT